MLDSVSAVPCWLPGCCSSALVVISHCLCDHMLPAPALKLRPTSTPRTPTHVTRSPAQHGWYACHHGPVASEVVIQLKQRHCSQAVVFGHLMAGQADPGMNNIKQQRGTAACVRHKCATSDAAQCVSAAMQLPGKQSRHGVAIEQARRRVLAVMREIQLVLSMTIRPNCVGCWGAQGETLCPVHS